MTNDEAFNAIRTEINAIDEIDESQMLVIDAGLALLKDLFSQVGSIAFQLERIATLLEQKP